MEATNLHTISQSRKLDKAVKILEMIKDNENMISIAKQNAKATMLQWIYTKDHLQKIIDDRIVIHNRLVRYYCKTIAELAMHPAQVMDHSNLTDDQKMAYYHQQEQEQFHNQ